MTNEQLNQYYSKDADKKQCWVSKDHNCPLKGTNAMDLSSQNVKSI